MFPLSFLHDCRWVFHSIQMIKTVAFRATVTKQDNVQRTRSLSNATSNTFQGISVQICLDDLDL